MISSVGSFGLGLRIAEHGASRGPEHGLRHGRSGSGASTAGGVDATCIRFGSGVLGVPRSLMFVHHCSGCSCLMCSMQHSVGLFVRMDVASARLTIVHVAHLHQGLWAERGAHNFTAFSRSMTAT